MPLLLADAAYLTALYAGDLEANKPGEEEGIANRMGSIPMSPRGGR